MERGSFLIVCSAIFSILVHFAAAQNVHIVGDALGWTIPPNASVSYSNWASGKTFVVGDILVFNFMTNQHDVLQVPKASYDACNQNNAIGNVITTGPANITLDSAGDHYYICTVGRHCQGGQKLGITVVSSTPGGANPPTIAPPPTTTTPTPPSPTTTPPPAPTTPTTPSPPTSPDACAPASSPNPNAGGPHNRPTTSARPPSHLDSASTSLASSFLLIIMFAGIALIF